MTRRFQMTLPLTLFCLSIALAVTTAGAAEKTPFSTWKNAVEFKFVSNFKLLWHDYKTGGKYNGSFWRPVVPKGYYLLGDVSSTYGGAGRDNPSGRRVAVVVRELQSGALAKPTGYRCVWHDYKSGAALDGSVWEPITPPGYVAMGTLGGGHRKHRPSVDAMRCVRKDLVVKASLGNRIWSDQGSGAALSATTCQIISPEAPQGMAYFSSGSFVTFAGYNHPAKREHACANVFQVSLEDANGKEPTLLDPQLDGYGRPSPFAKDTSTFVYRLPWFAVRDSGLQPGEQLTKSPIYHLVRKDRFRLVHHSHNNSDQVQEPRVSFTEGFSQTLTKSFSETTGVEFTVGYTPPGDTGGAHASVTLSYSMTRGFENSTTKNKEKTVDYPLKVSPGTAAAVYAIESSYSLHRDAGQGTGITIGGKIGNLLKGTQPESTVFASYPRALEGLEKALTKTKWDYRYKGSGFGIVFGEDGKMEGQLVDLGSWKNVGWRVIDQRTVELFDVVAQSKMVLRFDAKHSSFTAKDWDGTPTTGQRQR